MLLDEDPSTLISHTIHNFSLAPDKGALTRISTTLSSLSQARTQRLSTQQSSLHSVTRRLQSLQNNHSSLVREHQSAGHAELIMELDAQKFRIAKAAREAEEEGERLGSELDGLRARLETVEREGIEKGAETLRLRRGAVGEDATVLRLKLYRSLGIDFQPASAEKPNTLDRAVIRNMRKGDVHVVNIDPKFSRFFYANYLWGAMEG